MDSDNLDSPCKTPVGLRDYSVISLQNTIPNPDSIPSIIINISDSYIPVSQSRYFILYTSLHYPRELIIADSDSLILREDYQGLFVISRYKKPDILLLFPVVLIEWNSRSGSRSRTGLLFDPQTSN